MVCSNQEEKNSPINNAKWQLGGRTGHIPVKGGKVFYRNVCSGYLASGACFLADCELKSGPLLRVFLHAAGKEPGLHLAGVGVDP